MKLSNLILSWLLWCSSSFSFYYFNIINQFFLVLNRRFNFFLKIQSICYLIASISCILVELIQILNILYFFRWGSVTLHYSLILWRVSLFLNLWTEKSALLFINHLLIIYINWSSYIERCLITFWSLIKCVNRWSFIQILYFIILMYSIFSIKHLFLIFII